MVGSEEYLPIAQTAKQRESEQRLYAIADEIAPKVGALSAGAELSLFIRLELQYYNPSRV